MSTQQVVRSHPDGSIVTVWVVPGASRTEVVGYHGDALRVKVAAPPEKGKANRAVAGILSDALGAKVRLASGASSRRKRFVVVAVDPAALKERLGKLLD